MGALGASVVAAYVSEDVRASPAYHIVFATAVMPMMRLLDAETAHGIGIKAACMAPVDKDDDHECLRVKLWGTEFSNPIGLAAGFNKQGEAMGPLLKAGFGFVEVGTVTPKPQPGNAKPRMFRLVEDEAVINRYGFNSDGLDVVSKRVAAFRGERGAAEAQGDPPGVPAGPTPLPAAMGGPSVKAGGESASRRVLSGVVGLNVGMNKLSEDAAADYTLGIRTCVPLADYLVVNVSSPNTPGLRDLQRRSQLHELLLKAVEARDAAAAEVSVGEGAWRGPPLLVKIAPDLDDTELSDIIQEAIGCGVDGVIVSNTTIARPESLKSANKGETGGLSGQPLFNPSTEVLRKAYRLAKGRIPLIGAGGVASGDQAYEKIRAGASLVQLYTGMAYEGPSVAKRVKEELQELLEDDGFTSVQDAVGVDA